MNSKTSSKAGGGVKKNPPHRYIFLCWGGLFALRKILSERKILKE